MYETTFFPGQTMRHSCWYREESKEPYIMFTDPKPYLVRQKKKSAQEKVEERLAMEREYQKKVEERLASEGK